MTADLGPLLTSSPPDLSPDQIATLLAQHFGLAGPLRRLTSERDLNFRLATPTGAFVVKIANRAEPRAQTDLQTRALLHLQDSPLALPKVRRTLTDATEVETPAGLMRVLSYLEGTPLHLAPRTQAQTRAIGGIAAKLTAALADFIHPGADHILQWDIRQASALRPLLPSLPAEILPLCTHTLDHFDSEIAPRLATLPSQVVHNDLNPHNLLVQPDNPDEIAGILDFGDMVRTPRVCDLAVAASYQVGTSTPLRSLADFTAAYHAVLPLTRTEIELVFDLTATRMLTTLAIASWRAGRYPDNAPYILRNFPAARAGLLDFAALSRQTATETLLRACAMEPS